MWKIVNASLHSTRLCCAPSTTLTLSLSNSHKIWYEYWLLNSRFSKQTRNHFMTSMMLIHKIEKTNDQLPIQRLLSYKSFICFWSTCFFSQAHQMNRKEKGWQNKQTEKPTNTKSHSIRIQLLFGHLFFGWLFAADASMYINYEWNFWLEMFIVTPSIGIRSHTNRFVKLYEYSKRQKLVGTLIS